MMDEKTDEKEVDTKRRLFATSDIQRGSSSMEEQACCTKLALSVYKKAWEGAKKSKFRPQHISVLENKNESEKDEYDSDIEMGTECSSDYHENALKRESVFFMKPGTYNETEDSLNTLNNKREDIEDTKKENLFDNEKSSDLMNSDDLKNEYFNNNLDNNMQANKDDNNSKKYILIENFAEKTTDSLMKNVINETINKNNNGIFKITKPPMINDINKEESQEESIDIATVSMDIPTITITEDILDDSSVVLSECTLKTQASEDEVTDIPEDDQITLKSDDKFNTKLKRKVKKFSGKIKDIFSKKKDDKIVKDDDIQQPQQQNEEEKRNVEELCKQELTKKLEQQKKEEKEKEEAQKQAEKLAQKEKEIAKEEAERALRQKQREELNKLKELERKRREEEDKMQREHYRQKEEERLKRKEEEKMKKMKEEAERLAEIERIKFEEMEAKRLEKERKKQEKAKKKEAKHEVINTNELLSAKDKNTEESNLDSELTEIEKMINESIPSKSENQIESTLVRNIESPQLPRKTQQKDLSETCIYDEEISVPNESDGDSIKKETKKRKKMRKKLSDTKQKLKHFKDRALDSFPSMQSIKNKVKDFFPSSKEQYMNYTNRDQKTFNEYRKKYPDSDGEFFSDSELIESRRSTIKQKERSELFEEVETEERVQMLLGPISGPLRPPRRGEYGDFNPALSEPNLSKKSPKKPKRRPPPRPPPPCSLASSTSLAEQSMENVPLDDSDFDHMSSMIIPAHIYYKTVRERWQENKLNRLNIISRSSPNLRMKQFDSISIASKRSFAPEKPQHQKMLSCFWYSQLKTAETDSVVNFHTNANDSLPPKPPPRRSRGSARSSTQSRSSSRSRELNLDYFEPKDRANLAIDALYWKPFSWKTGRCRSLTELYLRRKRASSLSSPYSSMEPIESTLSYRLTNRYCAPPRPPLPYEKTKSTERIYSQINKTRKKIEERPPIQNRPLPLPPIPPRSYKKRSPSPFVRNENIIMRSFSPIGVIMKDASVETINLIDKRCILVEKQVQTSFDYDDDDNGTSELEKKKILHGPDEKICYKLQHNNAFLSHSTHNYPISGDNKENKQLSNEPNDEDEVSTPTPTITIKDDIQEARRERCLSDEISLGSVTSSRSYYDAQECDTDMDNLTDLDSFAEISSCQFQSLTDNPTFSQLIHSNKSQLPSNVPNEIVQHRSPEEERMELGDDSEDELMIPSSSQREIQQCIERKLRTKPLDSTNEW